MPLRNSDAFYDWILREKPSRNAIDVAAEFVLEVGDHSYLAPSLPVPEASNQPTDEMRAAALTVEGEASRAKRRGRSVEGEASVHIWYRHFYATGDIDIIGVSNLPHA